jgi:hypothetical protein
MRKISLFLHNVFITQSDLKSFKCRPSLYSNSLVFMKQFFFQDFSWNTFSLLLFVVQINFPRAGKSWHFLCSTLKEMKKDLKWVIKEIFFFLAFSLEIYVIQLWRIVWNWDVSLGNLFLWSVLRGCLFNWAYPWKCYLIKNLFSSRKYF